MAPGLLQRLRESGGAWATLGTATGVLVAWWALQDPPAPPPVRATVVHAPAPPAPLAAVAAAARPAPAAKPAPVLGARAKVPAAASAAAPAKAEVCGFGAVPASSASGIGTRAVPQADRQVALEAIERRIETQGDIAARAAMLAIGGSTPEERFDRGDRLARLASTSNDPVVYGLALRRCRQQVAALSPPGCQLLSTTQWAALDPGNAAAWLMVAADARQQRQTQAEQEAMYRAAMATRVEGGDAWLPGLVARATRGESSLGAALALERAWSLNAALPNMVTAQLNPYCRTQSLSEPERRQRCDALVQLLWQHGDSLMDLAQALRIATALRWPAERIDAMTQERTALASAAGTHQRALFDNGPADCEALQRWQAWSLEVAKGGEVAALRAQVAASGRSISQWAEEHQQDRAGGQVPVHGAPPTR